MPEIHAEKDHVAEVRRACRALDHEQAGWRDDERETLVVAFRTVVEHRAGCTCCPWTVEESAPAVERIITARLVAYAERKQPSSKVDLVKDESKWLLSERVMAGNAALEVAALAIELEAEEQYEHGNEVDAETYRAAARIVRAAVRTPPALPDERPAREDTWIKRGRSSGVFDQAKSHGGTFKGERS